MNIDEAISESFKLLAGNYGNRWAKPDIGTVAAWKGLLDDDEPLEVVKAVARWCRDGNEWPPTPGQIHRKIPANCRCGDCIRCNSRALERRLQISNRRDSTDWRSILPPRPTPQLEQDNA